MKTFVRLLALIAPYWLPMLLAAGLGFLTVAGGIGLMAAAAFLISAAALHPPVMALMPAVAGVRFFGLTRPVCRYLERYFAHDATFKLLSRLRVWFYTALEPLAPARLMEYRSGELLSRFAADVETLEQFYLRVLAPFLTALLVLLAVAGVFGAWLGPGLALTLLFFLLAAALAAPLAVRALSRGAGRQMLTARAALNVQMVDIIQGITEITAFNREEEQQEQVNLLSRKLLHLQGRLAWGRGLSSALGSLLMNLAMWSLLLLAIPLVRQGRLDGVYLAVLILGALSSFEAVLPLPMALQQLEESLAAARRLFAVTDAAPQVRDLPGPSPAPQNYTLLVKGLRFRYAQDEPWVLDGL
ncbi:MAG: ABC transporter transmembrane domain-containing protein, partial [Firmicutes bacterium]|nr:ABC transporter transmembrane domain-containing protein [Bacillota bacterium]